MRDVISRVLLVVMATVRSSLRSNSTCKPCVEVHTQPFRSRARGAHVPGALPGARSDVEHVMALVIRRGLPNLGACD